MRYADRMSQRLLYVIGAALGILAWIVLVTFTDSGMPTLLIFAVCWGISSGIGAQAFYSLWASELFATPYRASAQGFMFFVVRTATGLLSFFFPTLLAATGLTVVGSAARRAADRRAGHRRDLGTQHPGQDAQGDRDRAIRRSHFS